MPFMQCQGQRVSRPVLTSVRAWHDKVSAHGPAKVHFGFKANTSSHRWKSGISCEFYSQGLQNFQCTTSTFSGTVQILKTDGQKTTEHDAQPASTLRNIQFLMSVISLGERRHSIPSTISHSCASKYKLPLWHQIWTLPVGTLHQDGIRYLAILRNECTWGTGTWDRIG